MWMSLGFQDSNSPFMEEVIYLHDHIMVVMVGVVSLVGFFITSIFFNNFVNRGLIESHMVEVVWTVLPVLILCVVALPSLRLLYLLDEVYYPDITLKVMGHQWYWGYEYPEFKGLEFDSYMLSGNNFRLLDVDNRVVLPFGVYVRLLVSAEDVIHSWAVPSLAVKVDAVPGRVNQYFIFISRPGLFFGQCSEICGAYHSFMPIVVESVTSNSFISWVTSLS